MRKPRFGIREVAELMEVSPEVVYRGIRNGDPQFSGLPYWRTSENDRSHYRFIQEKVEAWWASKHERLPIKIDPRTQGKERKAAS